MAKKNKNYHKRNGQTKGQDNKGNKQNQNFEKKDVEMSGSDSGKGNGSSRNRYNDISWYANNEQLLKDAASFSFNNPLGNSFNLDNSNTGNVNCAGAEQPIPGVMSINLYPAFGECTDNSSSLNVAINNVDSFVRHLNSGGRNYYSADMGMYLAGATDLYSFHAWMKRVYGCVNLYTQKNRYYPDALLESMNVDPDDIRANLADFRKYINVCANRLSTFYIPATLPIFLKRAFIYEQVYLDQDITKAQTYVFNPQIFLKYNPTRLETGGCLEAVDMRPRNSSGTLQKLTFADIKARFDSMFNAMYYDEDCGTISGDIYKAYGDKLIRPTLIDSDYRVVPVYHEEVLQSIHNCRIIGELNPNLDDYDIILSQANDTTLLDAYGKASSFISTTPYGNINLILNSRKEHVEPADVMASTRLMATTTRAFIDAVAGPVVSARNYADVIVASLSVFNIKQNAQGSREQFIFKSSFLPINTNNALNYAYLSVFDWLPLMFYCEVDSTDPASGEVLRILGDVSNYSIITPENLGNINTTATLSLFGVPQEYTVR